MAVRDQVIACLGQNGYQALSGSSKEIAVCCRQEGEVRRAVCFLDMQEGAVLYREQYVRFKNNLVQSLRGERGYAVSLLMLFYTDNTDMAKRLAEDGDCFWVLHAGTWRVMVYETGDEGFRHLEAPLEQAFSEAGEEPPERRRIDFKKVPWVTFLLLAANIAVFLVLEWLGSTEDSNFLLAHGASYAPAVIKGKEYYRLFTSLFIHAGIEHLLNNMLLLFYMGSLLERQLGRLRYVSVYFLSGILAGLASIGYNTSIGREIVCVGASGAIFGLTGAVAALVLLQKGRLEYINGRRIAIMVALSLYGGFAAGNVDNAAHIGGLLAGAAITPILSLPYKKRAERRGTSL